ncbi:hypothetical protein HYV74_03095 [Candidatus Uhrbacteria bacterium]|nr:hypothetical protein [Candidatus Uhrbacteria bacterium]
MLSAEGTIRREDGLTIVEVPWKSGKHALGEPGVTVVNPDAEESDRIVQKVFARKMVYLPEELDRAIAIHVAYPDNFIISANGYSSLKPADLARYGIPPGAYEEAVKAMLRSAIAHLRRKFTAAQLRLVSGASAMGVDLAIDAVARECNITPLGFSCPRYMLWVHDDEFPVYVAESQEAYADRYIQSLDLLLATGGREQALKHDVAAACIYGRRIHFVDILSMLSPVGSVPATVDDGHGGRRVENAAAAFGRYVSFSDVRKTVAAPPPGGDIWDALFADVAAVATEVCRGKMSPGRKFV